MRKEIMATIVLGLLLLPAKGRAADQEFQRMDKNGDGRVTREEFQTWYPVEVWKKVDAAGKGYVEEKEWVAVKESVAQYRREEARDAEVK